MKFCRIIRVTFFFAMVPSCWNRAISNPRVHKIRHPISSSRKTHHFNSYEAIEKISKSDESPPSPHLQTWFLKVEPINDEDDKNDTISIHFRRAKEDHSKNEKNIPVIQQSKSKEVVETKKSNFHNADPANIEVDDYSEWSRSVQKSDCDHLVHKVFTRGISVHSQHNKTLQHEANAINMFTNLYKNLQGFIG